MVRGGKGVTVGLVTVVALVTTAVAWLLLRWWDGMGHALPSASWGAAALVVAMAAGVVWAAVPIRRSVRGKTRRRVNSVRALRTVVLAQAAALTGALVTGWYAGALLVLAANSDVESVRRAMVAPGAMVVSGVVLAVAGLVAQHMCRLPEDSDDPPVAGPSGAGAGASPA